LYTFHFSSCGRFCVHLTGVNDFGFFLQVEGILGVFMLSPGIFIVILLVVSRAHILGIRVPNKTIGDPGFFTRGVTSQKWCVRIT